MVILITLQMTKLLNKIYAIFPVVSMQLQMLQIL